MAARCDRPRGASASMSREKPGIFVQGPEEKRGFAGRAAGVVLTIAGILPDIRPSLGRGVPLPGLECGAGWHKPEMCSKAPLDEAKPTPNSTIGNFTPRTVLHARRHAPCRSEPLRPRPRV